MKLAYISRNETSVMQFRDLFTNFTGYLCPSDIHPGSYVQIQITLQAVSNAVLDNKYKINQQRLKFDEIYVHTKCSSLDWFSSKMP